MRVFVTGATGFVGAAVVTELVSAGHRVLGLSRSAAGARALTAAGAEAHLGSLEEPDSLRSAASGVDAVIHTAFNHDFSRFKENCELDRRTIEALGAALVGSERQLIVTSALGVLPKGVLVTEQTAPASSSTSQPRTATEEAADAVAARGVRVSVVRLPPSVHGDGDPHFVTMLIKIARAKGVSAYLGDGQNRWPAVHRLDAASLYKLALEKTETATRYHAVAEQGIAFRDIAAAIGRGLNLPVAQKTREEAASHFAGMAHFVSLDLHASSEQTQAQLGWRPQHPGLLADIEHGSYFETTGGGSR